MSYCLTSNFLYESSMFTTLKLEQGELFEVKQDTNKRSLVIVFQEGMLYSRLSTIPGFTIITPDEPIKEESLNTRNETLTIGNAKYWFKNGISRFSQLFNTVLDTGVNDYGEMVFISINRDKQPTVVDYLELLNKSGVIYCKILKNPSEFYIYNYNDIDVSKGSIEPSKTSKVTDFSYLSVSAKDTNTSFMRHCKNHYPEVEVLSEFSDLS